MKTLEQALETFGGRNGRFVWKHLDRFGIRDWGDCTTATVSEWVADIKTKVAPSTAKLYAAVLRSVLARYMNVVPDADVCDRLNVRAERSTKVYLTPDELARLESIVPRTKKQRYTQLAFLISAKTGMRISDTRRVSRANVKDGYLTYVSEKTNKEAKVPVGEKVLGWIEEINRIKDTPNLSNIEVGIRGMCEKAGITEQVKVFRAGSEKAEAKWKFVSSHTARVTFCTIMAQKGVPIMDICTMAGHSSPVMTERYIVRTAPVLNDEAMKFITE